MNYSSASSDVVINDAVTNPPRAYSTDVDVALKRFDILFRYLAVENTLYWTRSQFFLVANAALLAALANFLKSATLHELKIQEACIVATIGVIGLCLTLFWGCVLKSSEKWLEWWEKQCLYYEKTAFDGCGVLSESRPPGHRSIKAVARWTVRLFLIIWPLILAGSSLSFVLRFT